MTLAISHKGAFVTIRLDHLLMGLLGIALAAAGLFLGAQRLLHHSHPGVAIQPETAQGIEAGFVHKASAHGEVAQCSPSTYEITCSYAGKDSVVHKMQITRTNFCNYLAQSDVGSYSFNACSHKATATLSPHTALLTAMANVREAIPATEAYYSDNGNYRGATPAALRSYDRGVHVSKVTANGQRYCLQSTVQGQTASVSGPGGAVIKGPCHAKASPSSQLALTTAMANVRAAIPDMEAYYSDKGTYRGTTIAALRGYDTRIHVSRITAGDQRYCIESDVNGVAASVLGPGGTVRQGACN
jgi:hypothetical protein